MKKKAIGIGAVAVIAAAGVFLLSGGGRRLSGDWPGARLITSS